MQRESISDETASSVWHRYGTKVEQESFAFVDRHPKKSLSIRLPEHVSCLDAKRDPRESRYSENCKAEIGDKLKIK